MRGIEEKPEVKYSKTVIIIKERCSEINVFSNLASK